MITVYPYENLGRINHGWLDARHHFSFGHYHNPARMNFGVLRVINDDIIKAGKGFPMHPHNNMEIITYVRTGAITHRDNFGNEGVTQAGDVQVMSAGSGILHSEYNLETTDTTLYQIWIETNQTNVHPTWSAHQFPKEVSDNKLTLLVSGNPKDEAPLFIHQDASLYAGTLNKGTAITQPIKKQVYLLVSQGLITADGITMKKGDGAEITKQSSFKLQALSDSEVLVIDVPAK